MPLMIDDLRAEFGRQLAAQPPHRCSLDHALTHVLALAYAAGVTEARTPAPLPDEFDDKYAAAIEAGENPFCP